MSYKSLVVHLDTSARAHSRLELALRLARRFGAHLTGLFAVYTPEPHSFYVMAGSADYFREHRERRDERLAALERLFHAEAARANVPAAWVRADERANVAVPRAARLADLVIAGQSDPNDPETYVDDQFPENLVLSAGRPVLFWPYTGNSRRSANGCSSPGTAAAKRPVPRTMRSPSSNTRSARRSPRWPTATPKRRPRAFPPPMPR